MLHRFILYVTKGDVNINYRNEEHSFKNLRSSISACHNILNVFCHVLCLQGNTCLENGSYLMNFLGCANCHQRDFVLISDKTMVNEDEEEIVTYLRE